MAELPDMPIRGVISAPSVLGRRLHERIDALPIDWRCKGFPFALGKLSLPELRAAGLAFPTAGFVTPIATLRASALTTNLAAMARYTNSSGVSHAPHGKTTMAPQVFDAQLAVGAWGITFATPWQARVGREFGLQHALIANEVTDPEALRWMSESMQQQGGLIVSYVDDVRALHLAQRVLEESSATVSLPVLIELGINGARTGVRSIESAVELAREVAASPHHDLVGVAGWEGSYGHSTDAGVLAEVRGYLASLRELAARIDAEELFDSDTVILTAGGSAYFDLVVDVLAGPLASGRTVLTIIRSGAVVSHDEGNYGEVSPFRRRGELTQISGGALVTAIEVWARVLSRPESNLVLIDAGKRDVPYDSQLPSVLRSYRGGASVKDGLAAELLDTTEWRFFKTNDQHGFLNVPETADVEPGDLIVLGITHPCTLFDKWRALPVLDDGDIITDVIHTFF